MNDTDRLNFILNYFTTDDIGDETYVPGVCIDNEELENDLTWEPEKDGKALSHYKNWDDDIRVIIDRAIKSHNQPLDSDTKSSGD